MESEREGGESPQRGRHSTWEDPLGNWFDPTGRKGPERLFPWGRGPCHDGSTMRVLLVTHAFLPRSLAGVEVYTASLARALLRQGNSVGIFTAATVGADPHGGTVEEDFEGMPVWRLTMNHPYRPLAATVRDGMVEEALRGVMKRFRPDVVHFQHLLHASSGCIDEVVMAGTRAVLTLHDYYVTCPSGGQRFRRGMGICETRDFATCAACFRGYRHREGPLESLALTWQRRTPTGLGGKLFSTFARLPAPVQTGIRRINGVLARSREENAAREGASGEEIRAVDSRNRDFAETLSRAHALLSPSAFLAHRLEEEGVVERGRIGVIPNGTDLPQHPSPPPGVKSPSSPLRALFLGTPSPHKGLELLAEVATRLSLGVAEILIQGPNPFPAYRAELSSLSQARIRFLGEVPPAEVAAVLDACDVLCLPSQWWENAPLTLLEARARGRPVLASRIGGIPESVSDGVDGFLLPPSDVTAWVQALESLARDRGRLARLAASVRPPPSMDQHALAVRQRYS